jgi:hypothetical protein
MLGQDITRQAGNNLMATTNDFNGGVADTPAAAMVAGAGFVWLTGRRPTT